MNLTPINRAVFDAGKLVSEYPPRWQHINKRLVYQISGLSGFPTEGQIVFARWPARKLPESVPSPSPFTVRAGVFAYAAADEETVVDWHLNFSDPELFVAYGSALLAQDELQVAEHPILGSMREALLAEGIPAITEDRQGNPTPVTVTGVQRRCVINTLPDPQHGCPGGLYGNQFSRATQMQVRAATRPLSPPTISNILAMAAPSYGNGKYSRKVMLSVLTTAYTGFMAARAESHRLKQGESRTVIHTGFWGCGAFGGDRRLMTVLQNLAADLARVETVFWAFDEAGKNLAMEAHDWFKEMRKGCSTVDEILDQLLEQKFQWGTSDGN